MAYILYSAWLVTTYLRGIIHTLTKNFEIVKTKSNPFTMEYVCLAILSIFHTQKLFISCALTSV